MMLLPFTRSPSFSTQISQLKRLHAFTNIAEGRACRPSRFRIVSSLLTFGFGVGVAFAAEKAHYCSFFFCMRLSKR